jgi:Domain of unknown function (DUF4173)
MWNVEYKFMNERTKIGLQILQSALLIGISGDFLLRRTPWGLNAFLWVMAVTVAMLAITLIHRKELWTKQTQVLYLALVFFSSTFLYRASESLLVFNVIAIFIIWAVLTLPNLKLSTNFAGISHYILGFVWSGLNLLLSPFLLVFNDIRWKVSTDAGWTKTFLPILRGVIIAAPLLLIFGGLFMAADAAFEGMILRTFNINTGEIFSHLLLTGFLTWIVAGYLRASFIGSLTPDNLIRKSTENATENNPKFDWRNLQSSSLPNALTIGTVEVSIIWGTLNLLFFSFVLMQLPYLFGGFELVQQTEGLKLADYARRGVGELVFVSILVLPLLLFGHWFLNRENKTAARLFQSLAGIQIGLLFVIMLSAAQRMWLYTGNQGYGLTLDRFYPMVLMIALAAIFIWFAATIFANAREKFAWGALWIALFTLGSLNILNPEDFVLKTNLRLQQEGRNFDAWYNTYELGEDAMPIIIEQIQTFDERSECLAQDNLMRKLRNLNQYTGLRNWNYSRWKAKNILQDYANKQGWSNDYIYRNCYQEFPVNTPPL